MAMQVYNKKMNTGGSISFSARLRLSLVATDLTHRLQPQALQHTGSNASVVKIMFTSSTIVAATTNSTNVAILDGEPCSNFHDGVIPPQIIVSVIVNG